nr:hypothetical protein [Tanacetum cinerariifolium]
MKAGSTSSASSFDVAELEKMMASEICEHGGEIVYGIGLVCHGGGLCGDVSEEEGGQLDEGLDIGGGGSVFGSGIFFWRHGNENESTK